MAPFHVNEGYQVAHLISNYACFEKEFVNL